MSKAVSSTRNVNASRPSRGNWGSAKKICVQERMSRNMVTDPPRFKITTLFADAKGKSVAIREICRATRTETERARRAGERGEPTELSSGSRQNHYPLAVLVVVRAKPGVDRGPLRRLRELAPLASGDLQGNSGVPPHGYVSPAGIKRVSLAFHPAFSILWRLQVVVR